ncbi:lipocalin-like domain-containing protein [Siccirubricoccus sp. KC 17139]|uniref:Lipocalin-like domain-containing protein n=1 Tax=Siccirubricoccus soli TaxID=2899147 RepID=A0ABT1D1M0_9PROT|nr:lipocalin-like domain-containing protein [Siccirubricoccus soli]MCO6415801.1 lipocalin-like domain-containing protein [Siccirubricoccus soli]MCP2681933.1 lipocalin-like domain-containing protein [Siccirubricoccus soli]
MAIVGATISMLGLRTVRAANTSAVTTSLIGTWKMVDATSRDPDGKALAQPYGPKGMGIVTLNAEGRMMAVLCDGRAEVPDGVRRDYASYCGNYTFDGTTLITKVDATSTSRIAIGSNQVRKVRFEGNRLVLTPPPAELNGVVQHRDIFWERISTEPA